MNRAISADTSKDEGAKMYGPSCNLAMHAVQSLRPRIGYTALVFLDGSDEPWG